MTPAHLAPAPLVLTDHAMLHIEWHDGNGSITQVFPAGTQVASAWAIVASIAAAMALHRHTGATWYVTPAPG